jgi:hypothetical protein
VSDVQIKGLLHVEDVHGQPAALGQGAVERDQEQDPSNLLTCECALVSIPLRIFNGHVKIPSGAVGELHLSRSNKQLAIQQNDCAEIHDLG